MAASLASRATQSARLVGNKFSKLKERLKGGRLERIGNYFHRIYSDYKAVASETVQDVKAKPGKTALYVAGCAFLTALAKTNPSEKDFRDLVVEMEQDLMCVSNLIRNPIVDGQIQTILKCRVHDTLHFTNLGLFSIVWRSEFSPSSDLYVAQCKSLRPKWRDFHKHILDVGVCNRWVYLDSIRKDFDVNPAEWEGKKDD